MNNVINFPREKLKPCPSCGYGDPLDRGKHIQCLRCGFEIESLTHELAALHRHWNTIKIAGMDWDEI